MAIGLRRKVRLDSRRERQGITRRKNGDFKRAERARRDTRVKAKLATLLGTEGAKLSPEVASWVSAQLGKSAVKASADEIKALLD